MNKVVLTDADFIKMQKTYKESGDYLLYCSLHGEQSFYVRQIDTKYLNRKHCRQWEGEWRTAGETARYEIDKIYPFSYMAKGYNKKMTLSAPMAFGGRYYGQGCYIDIKSAYWQIYRYLYLDSCYPSLIGEMPLSGIADNLKEWKPARNALPGTLYGKRFLMWKYNEYHLIIKRMLPHNPVIWWFCNAVLHQLAHYSLSCGAIYVASDGYIFPHISNVERFEKLLMWIGLEYRKWEGGVHLERFGAYSIAGRDEEGKAVVKTTKRLIKYVVPKNSHPPKKVVTYSTGYRWYRVWKNSNGYDILKKYYDVKT